jgi:hypothetical protein
MKRAWLLGCGDLRHLEKLVLALLQPVVQVWKNAYRSLVCAETTEFELVKHLVRDLGQLETRG